MVSRRLVVHLAALATFVLLTSALTYPLAPRAADHLPYHPPMDPLNDAWRTAWTAHALVTNPAGLFDANIYYPYRHTYAYDEVAFTNGLITAPVTLLSGNPVLGVNTGLLLSFVLGGYSAFLLARRLTGSAAASMLAGIVFAFNPFRFAHLVHLSLSSSFWTPLALLALDSALRTRRWRYALAFGLCFAAQALAAFYYGFYLALASGLLLVYHLARARALPDPRMIVRLAAGAGLSLLLAGPFIWVYLQVHQATGFERPATELMRYSAGLASFLATPSYNRIYGYLFAGINALRPNSNEYPLFPGLVAGVMGVAGLWIGRRDPRGLFFGLLGLVALVLSLGPRLQLAPVSRSLLDVPLPYQALYEWVPGFKSMRVPARLHMLTTLALSVGVAFAYLHLARWAKARAGSRGYLRALLPAVIGAAMLVEYLSVPVPLVPIETGSAVPPVYRWLAQQPRGPVVDFPTIFEDDNFQALMLRKYAYFSTYDWQPLPLARQDVRPLGTDLLWVELNRFPTVYGLTMLEGLGVRYLVYHTDYAVPGETEHVQAELEAAGSLEARHELPGAVVFELRSSAEISNLRAVVPVDSRVLVMEDPAEPASPYLGILAHALAPRSVAGDIRAWFGSEPPPPDPAATYDFVLLARPGPPPPPGYAATPVWSNRYAQLFARAGHTGMVPPG